MTLEAATYYQCVMAERDTISVDDAAYKNLVTISQGDGFIIVPERTIFVNDWNVSDYHIHHRHPEITGATGPKGEPGELEWTTSKGACSLCGAQIPKAIWLLNKFYRF